MIRIHVAMPADLVRAIDAARPDGVTRAHWIRRAVEQTLRTAESAEATDAALANVTTGTRD